MMAARRQDSQTNLGRSFAAVDICELAHERGFASFAFAEHHGSPDEFAAPLQRAFAVAPRTMAPPSPVLVAPFYDPVRLAEDLAVLDLVSGWRVDLVLVAGYVLVEFLMLGRHRSDGVAALAQPVGLPLVPTARAGPGRPESAGVATVTRDRTPLGDRSLRSGHTSRPQRRWCPDRIPERHGPYGLSDESTAALPTLVPAPSACLELVVGGGPDEGQFTPLAGGIRLWIASDNLRTFETDVLPRLPTSNTSGGPSRDRSVHLQLR